MIQADIAAVAKLRAHFQSTGLDRTAINTIYSHVLNPMIASRSYMSIEPIELWLDTKALRRGLVYPVDPDTDPTALCVQDSGMVPVSTQIAIVNPETRQLCHIGEYGEIWTQSEACAKSFYLSKQEFDRERFNGRIVGGDQMPNTSAQATSVFCTTLPGRSVQATSLSRCRFCLSLAALVRLLKSMV